MDLWRIYLNYVGLHFISSAHYEINSQNHCWLGLDRIAQRVLRAQARHHYGQYHRRQTSSPGRPENILHPASQATRPTDRGGYYARLQRLRDAQTQPQPLFCQGQDVLSPREVIFIALKQEKRLELWARDSGEFRFIRDYYIQAASGVVGPKLRQGDRQVPEGIYRIVELNPNSHYHLSMKLNYPNEFDLLHARQEGRTAPGSDILIHGKAVSIGYLAMGDEAIEELFVLTEHEGVENVKVVIAPHDPRTYPLKADSKALPEWTPELYAIISREIKALSPVLKPAKTGLLPSKLDFVSQPPQGKLHSSAGTVNLLKP